MDDRKAGYQSSKDNELASYLDSIGARSLASELRNLRFRNSIVEHQIFIENHLAKVTEQELYRDRILQKSFELQSSTYDRAQAYDNFIVTLGYAGAFAIWTIIKDHMSPWDMKLVALLLGASLFFFITWVVVQMLFLMRIISSNAEVVRGNFPNLNEHIDAIQKQEEKSRQASLRFQRFWPYFFVPTLILGFGALLILLSLLLVDILGVNFSFESVFRKIA